MFAAFHANATTPHSASRAIRFSSNHRYRHRIYYGKPSVFDTFIDARITLSNLLFLLLVCVLLWLFWNEVKSNSACKTFVFLLSVAYGSIITIAVSALATPLGFPDITDLRLYSPEKLGVFAILELITLPIGCWFMLHVVRPLVAEKFDTKVWVRFNVLPIGIFLLLVLIYWIPSRSIDSASTQIALLAGVLVVGVVAIFCLGFCDIPRFKTSARTI